MKASTNLSQNKTRQWTKTVLLLLLTSLFLTGGTAYAGHRHHGYNSGASITFDYVYYPKVHLYYGGYSRPHHYQQYSGHHYRGHRGSHKPWVNKRVKHHRRGHHDY